MSPFPNHPKYPHNSKEKMETDTKDSGKSKKPSSEQLLRNEPDHSMDITEEESEKITEIVSPVDNTHAITPLNIEGKSSVTNETWEEFIRHAEHVESPAPLPDQNHQPNITATQPISLENVTGNDWLTSIFAQPESAPNPNTIPQTNQTSYVFFTPANEQQNQQPQPNSLNNEENNSTSSISDSPSSTSPK